MKQPFRIYFIALLAVLFVSSGISAKTKSKDIRNIDRIIRVGLEYQGHPLKFYIYPSTKYIEIFDNKKKKSVYSGKAKEIKVAAISKGRMKVTIDKKKNFFYFTGELIFSPIGRPPSFLKIKGTRRKSYAYRGSIIIKPLRARLQAINLVDIEDYLKSVVPSEIYNRAGSAALEAQAIAARTYAVRNMDRHKKAGFNICDKVHCQAYRGMLKEVPATSKAVLNSIGKILTFNRKPANTVYHSNCGGILKSSKKAWGGKKIPYLVSHVDGLPGKKLFCVLGKQVKKRKAPKKIQKPKRRIIVRSLPWNTSKKYRSNFGHRVGMCQDGAIGMAHIGYTTKQILAFYYPGTALVTLDYGKVFNNLPSSKRKYHKKTITAHEKLEKILAERKAQKKDKELKLETPPKMQPLVNPTQKLMLKELKNKKLKANSIRQALRDISRQNGKSSNRKTKSNFKKLFWNSKQPEANKH